MGKKGKDKNKLARMSEEERLRYLQHRAELEEEAKRRKQQLISTFMKVNSEQPLQHFENDISQTKPALVFVAFRLNFILLKQVISRILLFSTE